MTRETTPPEAPDRGSAAYSGTPPAALSCSQIETPVLTPIQTLTQRADFLRAARASRARTPGFALQARKRQDAGPDTIRVGFTCSKKVGNAVARNRAKRRLRAAARQVLPVHGQPGWDYVLIGFRGATADRPFAQLTDDLAQALQKLHRA